MLDHRHPAGGREQRRARREIEAAGPITAGTDDVDGIERGRQLRAARLRTHRRGEAAQFAGSDSLGAQRHQQRPAARAEYRGRVS